MDRPEQESLKADPDAGLSKGYGPHNYAAFVTDPDGDRIEAYRNKTG